MEKETEGYLLLHSPAPTERYRAEGSGLGAEQTVHTAPQDEGGPEQGFRGLGDARTYLEPLWTVYDAASPRRPPPSVER